MKKLFIYSILFLALTVSVLNFVKTGDAKENPSDELQTKIEKFSELDQDKQVKVERIVTEKKFDDHYTCVLFKQKNKSIGYAILKNDAIVSVVFGENSQKGYEQFKNYSIIFGEKPNENYTELEITINAGNNHEDIEKKFQLDNDRYFLFIEKLPKEIKYSNINSDNFNFK